MDSKSVGRRIASARLGAGFRSSAAFGAAIGKSEFTVRAYECGRLNPPTKVLELIAEVTGRTIQWLLGSDEEEVAQGTVNVPLDTLRQLIANSEGKEKDPLNLIEAGPEKGIIELLNDDDLCRRFAISQEERAALLTIRGGLVKTKEQAIIILTALKS